MQTYEISFFSAIILFFATEFIYENSLLVCVLHFRWVYNNFKSIFNKNSQKENVGLPL